MSHVTPGRPCHIIMMMIIIVITIIIIIRSHFGSRLKERLIAAWERSKET